MSNQFRDRRDAGRQLACALQQLRPDNVYVLGMPTGGVPIAYEIAHMLDAPLDVLVTRTLPALTRHGPPLGVLGSGGARLLNRDIIYGAHVPARIIDDLLLSARVALLAEESEYRDGASLLRLQHRTVLLVDDGTSDLDRLRQSIQLVRELEAERVVAALPTMSRGQRHALALIADDVVTVMTAEVYEPLRCYDDFTPTTAGEVRALLELARAERQAA